MHNECIHLIPQYITIKHNITNTQVVRAFTKFVCTSPKLSTLWLNYHLSIVDTFNLFNINLPHKKWNFLYKDSYKIFFAISFLPWESFTNSRFCVIGPQSYFHYKSHLQRWNYHQTTSHHKSCNKMSFHNSHEFYIL